MTTSIRRALLSVSDKTGLVEFASGLAQHGVQLISTGGTARALVEAGLEVTDVSQVTGFPEIMDGRVKTLHPKVHGGLLAVRNNAEHIQAMQDHAIEGIDLLVVNLYPFEATLAAGANFDTCIENVDIGGPAMTRAAAKNHGDVTVVVSPDDYETVLAEIEANNGATLAETRVQLAARAFALTAAYDTAVSTWLLQQAQIVQDAPHRAFAGRIRQTLRYGENPHQWAAFYTNADTRPGVATAEQIQGKALSYNNINDTDAAYECVAEFDPEQSAVCVIVKHANPCGVAMAATLTEAYELALKCDPVSAFGGIIAFNRQLDAATAREISKIFTEVIIAPGVDDEARQIIAEKTNLRLLVTTGLPDPRASATITKSVSGGLLVQSRDNAVIADADLKAVTKRQPSDDELRDMTFAFKVAKHVKSNAIVYARDGATVGIGAGQMSRIDSSRIAARKSADAAEACGQSEPLAKRSVVASDAFFPFADGLLQAAEAGATAVIQPGGSMRDDDVIKAADEAGLAMVFTGVRHFRH